MNVGDSYFSGLFQFLLVLRREPLRDSHLHDGTEQHERHHAKDKQSEFPAEDERYHDADADSRYGLQQHPDSDASRLQPHVEYLI